jgi:hypothetical protein
VYTLETGIWGFTIKTDGQNEMIDFQDQRCATLSTPQRCSTSVSVGARSGIGIALGAAFYFLAFIELILYGCCKGKDNCLAKRLHPEGLASSLLSGVMPPLIAVLYWIWGGGSKFQLVSLCTGNVSTTTGFKWNLVLATHVVLFVLILVAKFVAYQYHKEDYAAKVSEVEGRIANSRAQIAADGRQQAPQAAKSEPTSSSHRTADELEMSDF